jgi:hypothetical protein
MEFLITNSSLNESIDLKIKLIVKHGGNEIDWIMMTINGTGFSIFSLRDFEEHDVISDYLGTKVDTREKLDYAFYHVNGCPHVGRK